MNEENKKDGISTIIFRVFIGVLGLGILYLIAPSLLNEPDLLIILSTVLIEILFLGYAVGGSNLASKYLKKFGYFIATVIILLVGIVYMFGGQNKNISDEGQALAHCMKRYGETAPNDFEICEKCSKYSDNRDYYYFWLEGKMETKLGRWEEKVADCKIDKETMAITHFQLEPSDITY